MAIAQRGVPVDGHVERGIDRRERVGHDVDRRHADPARDRPGRWRDRRAAGQRVRRERAVGARQFHGEGHGGHSTPSCAIVSAPKEADMASSDKNRTKFLLDEKDLPTKWYNIQADLPSPLPAVLHPGTGKPIGPQDLAPLFPMELIKQEVSQARWIEIPDEVRDVYRLWRPTPLVRARRLEKALGTPARIYYKYEGVSPAGSHKPNTAVAQAYYNKKEKVDRLSTETGAGQWGSALAFACSVFG